MNLIDWGYNEYWDKHLQENNRSGFEPGRIIAEYKERYVVATEKGETEAEITGNIRFTAQSREDFPAVGDWVLVLAYDSGFAIIQQILPRMSAIKRQSVGHFGEVQLIAANVDFAFLVQAADRDFNINRLERYLTICYASKVEPVIVLTKTDLIDESYKSELLGKINRRIKDVPVIAISNESHDGFTELKSLIQKGKTYCMLGSSGVGKSTLINNLAGKTVMQTGTISESSQRGKHVTSHREISVLENGGIFIDNPGMREVGITDTAGGLETTFESIADFAANCRYSDCTHVHEKGCAVIESVDSGEIDRASYENYLKMVREKIHFETSVAEKRKRDKHFGKILKDYFKQDVKQKGK